MAEHPMPQPAAVEQIRKLTSVSREMTYATSADAVMELSVRRAADLLEASATVLMVKDLEGLLRVGAAHGVSPEMVKDFQEPLEETLIHRLRLLTKTEDNDPFLGVPLVARGEVTGLLGAARPGGKPFAEQDEWSLSVLADQTAVALATMQADEEVRRIVDESLTTGVANAEEQDRTLASLGHEFRSPLAAIESYAHLLRLEIQGPLTERQAHAVDRIRMAGQHLNSLVNRTIEMAKLSAGAVEVETRPVSVERVVEEASDIIRPRLKRKQQLAQQALSDLTVVADPDQLRQILVNLISNAIKFAGEEGRIVVGARPDRKAPGGYGIITVADDGPGIPVVEQEKIFQPYYRLSGPETPGMGLGLAISRELVRRMGGDLSVESEPGRGSTFAIRLELAAPTSPKEPSAPKETSG